MRSIALLALLTSTAYAIWPIPSKYEHGESVLWIERDKIDITYHGPGAQQQPPGYGHGHSGHSGRSGTPKIVTNAIERTYDTLFNKNFVPYKLRPRLSNFEPAAGEGTLITSIVLRQTGSGALSNGTSPDESYSLTVTEDGQTTISAKTSVGLLYGLNTFTQLFFESTAGGVYTQLAPVTIEDAPKFKWRGLNLDTSRTFKPMKDIYRTLDAMAYNKMNRLHWHVTDAQSWPLEIPSMPELAAKGVYAPGESYSADDVAAIQAYGTNLGIKVAMEIDMPGHTSSIWFSHPELITAFNQQPDWTTYCAEPPCGSLKLNSTGVYDFLEKLLDDLLPRLKPYTSYFHLGGDEVNVNAYNLDDTVQSNSSAVLQPLMQKFMDRNMQQVTQTYGLTPLVWEEMLLTWNLTLPKNTIIQTWGSVPNAVPQVVEKGYEVLVGDYNYWYLDCGRGQWLDFYPENAANFFPWNDYCAPVHNWRVVYSLDPLEGVSEDLAHLVLGGEVHIWSEQTDEVNLDGKLWPRACAAAEVLWSGSKDPKTGANRSQVEASPRLTEMRERLVARGVAAEPIQMPFCTQNGTQCAYPV